MPTYPSKVHVVDIVKWLERKRDGGLGTVLLLGARTGGLFRSKALYKTSQYFSPRTFPNMSHVEQFAECYRVLHQEDFSKSDIHSILLASLKDLEPSDADLSLSELVRAGIFDIIISTNVDDLLQRAFVKAGMKEESDFRVIIPQTGFVEDPSLLKSRLSCCLLKVFGDLTRDTYDLIRHDFYLDTNEKLKKILLPALQDDLLVLGYDPYWDRPIRSIIPLDGKEVWYVNEDQVEASLMHLLQTRKGRYLTEGDGRYEQFVQALHWHLMGETPMSNHHITSEPITLPPTADFTARPSVEGELISSQPQSNDRPNIQYPLSTSENGQRSRIFIVYSQEDKRSLKQLQKHLAIYDREKFLDFWDDTKITAGMKWQVEIQNTLHITRVAVLLVSADFIASDFIAKDILPPLLQSAATGGAIIIPVILNHCMFERTPLYQFQPINSPTRPVAEMKASEKQKLWVNLGRQIADLVKEI